MAVTTGKEVNFIHWIRISLASVFYTLQASVNILYLSARGRLPRETADDIARRWSEKLLNRIQLNYRSIHQERFRIEPERPYIIMSNHGSHYDIPLIFTGMPGSIRMLAKKELFRVPIWGRAMAASEFISIDRQNRNKAIKDLERAREKMESGIVLWIAPEGTRSRTGKLNPFKKGGFMLALQTGATIIPVGIRGAWEILPAKTLNIHIGGSAEVHVGNPIDASKYSMATRDQLMEDVAVEIQKLAEIERETDPQK